MTDPAPSPPAGQPPVPNRPMPILGRGWSAHPDFGGVPPAEPYQPKPRPRPAGWGWPKTGNVGTKGTLTAADRAAVTVPARPYEDELPTPSLGATGSSLGDEAPVVDVTKPGFGIVSIEEARSWGITPPPAVELLAMADDLNAHGGVDETFVAALLREAADPSHLIGDRNPVTTPRAVDNPLDDDAVASARRQLGIAQWVPATEVPGPKRSTTEILEAFRETVTALTPVLDAAGFGDPSQAPDCSAGRHIWSMTSPVRCVECRRYLRPWWRRALDRVRRWR